MDQIKKIGLVICILMLMMAYLKQVIPRGKIAHLMKAIISIFILISVIQGVMDFDFNALKNVVENTDTHSEEIWESAADMVEEGLKKEFSDFLKTQNITATIYDVQVSGDQSGFKIESVLIGGTEGQTAKNLIAGRYQVSLLDIEVQNE